MKNFLELEAIKEVLVEMAANDELPIDMTQLDIHEVDKLAKQKLKDDEQYRKLCMIENLGELTSYSDDDEIVDALKELQKQEDNGNGDSSADLHVTIWEPFENRFTVSELLEEIS